MFISNKLLIIDKPGPVIPHLKKQGEQFSARTASGAKAVINIGDHSLDTLLLKEKG